jgi:hypothetical protein
VKVCPFAKWQHFVLLLFLACRLIDEAADFPLYMTIQQSMDVGKVRLEGNGPLIKLAFVASQ